MQKKPFAGARDHVSTPPKWQREEENRHDKQNWHSTVFTSCSRQFELGKTIFFWIMVKEVRSKSSAGRYQWRFNFFKWEYSTGKPNHTAKTFNAAKLRTMNTFDLAIRDQVAHHPHLAFCLGVLFRPFGTYNSKPHHQQWDAENRNKNAAPYEIETQ